MSLCFTFIKCKLKITQIKKVYSQGTTMLTVVVGFATWSEHFNKITVLFVKKIQYHSMYISNCLENKAQAFDDTYMHTYI